MDYYSKYQKYKLKFLNLRKQIGGEVGWQKKSEQYGNWEYYIPEESQIIEEHSIGEFILPSNHVINKVKEDFGYEQYFTEKNKKKSIKIRRIANKGSFAEESSFEEKIVKTMKELPVIWNFTDPNTLHDDLICLFAENSQIINDIWGNPNYFEEILIEDEMLFKEMINTTDPSMIDAQLKGMVLDCKETVMYGPF
jgi:hypothetical protein